MKKFFKKLGITSLAVVTYPLFLGLRHDNNDGKNFFQNIKECWRNS